MAVEIEVDTQRLRVRMTGWDRLWAVSTGVDVPISTVSGVRPVSREEAFAKGPGLRFPGSYWPGVIKAGTYLSREHGRSLWCAHRAERLLLIELAGHWYQRLILEVDEPERASRAIARARFR